MTAESKDDDLKQNKPEGEHGDENSRRVLQMEVSHQGDDSRNTSGTVQPNAQQKVEASSENHAIVPRAGEIEGPSAESEEPVVSNGVLETVPDKDNSATSTADGSADKESSAAINEQAWEEPKPAPFKDAPPPPVNFWAQRMAQIPKTKASNGVLISNAKQPVAGNGLPSLGVEDVKIVDAASDTRKHDGKRKPKPGTDERFSNKDNVRTNEGKLRSNDSKQFALY